MPITNEMKSNDMNDTVIANVNSMLTTYGLTGATPNVVKGNSMLASTIQSLYNNLVICNNHVNNRTKIVVNDITNYQVGDYINTVMVNLIETKANSVKSTFCSCNCNQCSVDCDRCSCNCNRCSCNCDNCSVDSVYG